MTAHAILGASSAHRWMTCPGSVPLSRDIPRADSPHAYLGSAAHRLGEICLLEGTDPFEYLGEDHPDPAFDDVEVDSDMVDAVSVYTDHIRSYGTAISEDTIERRVKLSPLGDWAKNMFGTADYLAQSQNVLLVDDYKHGQGVVVEAENNPQFMYYGLGGLLALPDPHYVKQVRTTVIQPRGRHDAGPVRYAMYGVQELLDWGEQTLKPAVLKTFEAEDTYDEWGHTHTAVDPEWAREYLNPEEKACQFCAAKGFCPALREKAMEAAMLEFDGEGGMKPVVEKEDLTAEQTASILRNEKFVQKWLAGVAEYAEAGLARGRDVTGGQFKLVEGRSKRDWKNEGQARETLLGMGFSRDDLITEKFATPAQAEKLVGKKAKGNLADLISTTKGKPTLAPIEDKRPSIVTGPEDDFIDT